MALTLFILPFPDTNDFLLCVQNYKQWHDELRIPQINVLYGTYSKLQENVMTSPARYPHETYPVENRCGEDSFTLFS